MIHRYINIRQRTEDICAPLEPEDYTAELVLHASPTGFPVEVSGASFGFLLHPKTYSEFTVSFIPLKTSPSQLKVELPETVPASSPVPSSIDHPSGFGY